MVPPMSVPQSGWGKEAFLEWSQAAQVVSLLTSSSDILIMLITKGRLLWRPQARVWLWQELAMPSHSRDATSDR